MFDLHEASQHRSFEKSGVTMMNQRAYNVHGLRNAAHVTLRIVHLTTNINIKILTARDEESVVGTDLSKRDYQCGELPDVLIDGTIQYTLA